MPARLCQRVASIASLVIDFSSRCADLPLAGVHTTKTWEVSSRLTSIAFLSSNWTMKSDIFKAPSRLSCQCGALWTYQRICIIDKSACVFRTLERFCFQGDCVAWPEIDDCISRLSFKVVQNGRNMRDNSSCMSTWVTSGLENHCQVCENLGIREGIKDVAARIESEQWAIRPWGGNQWNAMDVALSYPRLSFSATMAAEEMASGENDGRRRQKQREIVRLLCGYF